MNALATALENSPMDTYQNVVLVVLGIAVLVLFRRTR